MRDVYYDYTNRYYLSFVFICAFQVANAEDNEYIGTITKQWSGLAKEYFSDADNFGIRCESLK